MRRTTYVGGSTGNGQGMLVLLTSAGWSGLLLLIIVAGRVVIAFSRRNAE